MFKSSVLLLALVLSAPALWSAVTGDMTMTNALIRLLIAMPAATVMIGALRLVTGSYGHPATVKARIGAAARESAVADPGARVNV